ncbi:epoxide hydrolase-like protein [Corynespora cassiicola Philippines]|uniref:Epoxide hydrolase-like protein n=1 Tax=Corynespora cassiicola Philippines TaxID=1448308 RepID=A0A2T2NMF7_CORCC|nr:epoxide hydrolase-like protein [Corynespora cassiicola Philippines]
MAPAVLNVMLLDDSTYPAADRCPFGPARAISGASAKPFKLHISDQELLEWRQLLQLSKIGPLVYENSQEDRRFGITHKWLSDAKDYWLNTFDWRAQESRINSFANYLIDIEPEITVHFVALFSSRKDAVPVILMHGWPGSFIEFIPILTLLRERYPSADDLPYHFVVPSLPGYTLSSGGPLEQNWTLQDSTRVMDKLMRNLGFEKYIAQGGDVGSFLAHQLSAQYPGCVGAHLNLLRPKDLLSDTDGLQPHEVAAIERAKKWQVTGNAYALEHATRPGTIGLVLSSSPLALLTWIGEKFLEWTDEDPSLDTILTNVSLYWFTQGFPRSIYPYRALFGPDALSTERLEKPTGYSYFQWEIMPGIKKHLEKEVNLVHYSYHERGGHFGALERPKELLQDVEEYIKLAWKAGTAKL